MRKFGPKTEDHPSVGKPCQACGNPFKAGDYTTLVAVVVGPNAHAVEVHWDDIRPVHQRIAELEAVLLNLARAAFNMAAWFVAGPECNDCTPTRMCGGDWEHAPSCGAVEDDKAFRKAYADAMAVLKGEV